MPTTDLTADALEAAAAVVPAGQAIFMANLLRYNEHANYGADQDFPPCSGREAYYQRYVPAFGALADGTGIKPVWMGNVLGAIVVPADERWDDLAIVEYPNFRALRALVESAAYKAKADPHRVAALADWRLIATSKADLPG